MKYRCGKMADLPTGFNWTQRTSYAFIANKRRFPAELDDVTLAKHERLERDLEQTKRSIDTIKSKAIRDIETQRKALRRTIHGDQDGGDAENGGALTERKTNSIFRKIQDANAKTFTVRNQGYLGPKPLQKNEGIYLSKERFERIREDIHERLSDKESTLRTEKFKILLRRPSSADMLRKVKSLGPLRGVREITSPQSDSCVILTSNRTLGDGDGNTHREK